MIYVEYRNGLPISHTGDICVITHEITFKGCTCGL